MHLWLRLHWPEHRCPPPNIRAAARLRRTTDVAEATAKENEFHKASCPAAKAPGNSVHVRLPEMSWNNGSPKATRQRPIVQAPLSRHQVTPSCWRKSFAGTGPS